MTNSDLRTPLVAALRNIHDPRDGRDIIASGMAAGIVVKNGRAGFMLALDSVSADVGAAIRNEAEAAARAVNGITDVTIVTTAERAQPHAPASPVAEKASGAARIGRIIAVASGKGGVGKSTVAVNLALGLQALGLSAGLLDADIYGPSAPRMLGLTGKPAARDGKLVPAEAYGLKAMSIGLLVPDDQATIWRGPMATSALMQMVTDVAWGALDVLVVDLPPGTGDIQLTLCQRLSLAGAVIVSTPQDMALIDARKAIAMFNKVATPILGLVENMSQFVCPHCGQASDIFGHGGARVEAKALGVRFLGEIPLVRRIRETSDTGAPIVATNPASPEAQAFLTIADEVAAALGAQSLKPAPRILFTD